MDIQLERVEMPLEFLLAQRVIVLTDLNIFPSTYGRVFGDLLLPTYRLMKFYSVITRDNLIIFRHRGCDEFKHAPYDNDLYRICEDLINLIRFFFFFIMFFS